MAPLTPEVQSIFQKFYGTLDHANATPLEERVRFLEYALLHAKDMPDVRVKLLPHFVFPFDKDKNRRLTQEEILQPAQPGDAGIDVYAADTIVLPPGQRVAVPTGIALAVPLGWQAEVRPKSGLAIKAGLTVLNTPGTVDAGFRGEVMVILHNTAPVVGNAVFDRTLDALDESAEVAEVSDMFSLAYEQATQRFLPGQKIAQIVFNRVYRPEIVFVDDLDETERGVGGFGSTGA